MKTKFLLLLIPALIFLICGCRKTELVKTSFSASRSPIDAFTNLPENADPQLVLIANNIRSAESQTPFINEYALKNGYPVWTGVISNTTFQAGFRSETRSVGSFNTSQKPLNSENASQGKGFFIIPLADTTTNEITAYIACEKRSDSEYIYKTYNKRDILGTNNKSPEQRKNTKPLLAMFAYMEKEINGKSETIYEGAEKYKFSNVIISHGSLQNPAVAKSMSERQASSLIMPCQRALLDLYMIDYGDGTYDIIFIFSDCLTLPSVTVVASPRPTTSGSPGNGSYSGLLGSSPGSSSSSTPGNMGGAGGYTGSQYGWSANPWNVYWTSMLSNMPSGPGVNQELPHPYQAQLNSLTAILGLSASQLQWLSSYNNQQEILDLLDFLEEENYSAEAMLSAHIAIEAGQRGFFDSNSEATFDVVLDDLLAPADIPFKSVFKFFVKHQIAINRAVVGTKTRLVELYRASSDAIHLGFDIAGMVPVAGEIFDLTNATLYTIEGDLTNASLSTLSAIPFWGMIPASAKIIKNGRRIVAAYFDNKYVFPANNRFLRKAIGLTVGNPDIAHHIIPLREQTEKLVQKAAAGGFDINSAVNGIAISSAVHTGNHSLYSGKVVQKMTAIIENNPNITPGQAKTALEGLISDIRTWIQNNPGIHINNIIL